MTLLRYKAFGLSIASELPLAAPVEPDADAAIDLEIRIGLLLPPPAPGTAARISSALQIAVQDEAHWLLHACGRNPDQRFSLSIRPKEIQVGWNDGVEPEDLARHLTGLALAAHAFVCGRVCLHGSAARLGGRTLVILGNSGFGKSTLLSALVAGGAEFVTEEMVMLCADPTRVLTGVPALKVSAEAAAATAPPGLVRRAFSHEDYADEGVTIAFETARLAPCPATAICGILLLGARHQGKLPLLSEPLGAAEAANAIAGAGYWMTNLPHAVRLRVMRAAFDISLGCTVRHLHLPDDLYTLPQTVSFIKSQIAIVGTTP